MENYTKEQLWALIGKYVHHVGDEEGTDFLNFPGHFITEEDIIVLRQADDDFTKMLESQ